MKKTLRTVALMLVMGALSMPATEARGRQDYTTSQSSDAAPSAVHNQRPSNPGNYGPGNRPGNSGNRPGATTPPSRPGNDYRPGHNNGNRPGHNNGNRPGHNDNDYRPGHNNGNRPGHNNGNRPGHNDYRPDYRPGHRPGHAPHGWDRYYWHSAPSRPYLPPTRPWYRPEPPRGWRPSPHWRPITSVLGINFGSAINISLNLLFNNGYNVNGYTDDAIYLNNVPMLNYYWNDATMYYRYGRLAGSEFVDYSPYPNASRYDMVYNTLCSAYGMPVQVNNAGGTLSASWWGNGGQYITLTYGPQYAGNGSLMYYTTLSFGA